MEKHLIKVEYKYDVRYEEYKKDYYKAKFGENYSITDICHNYLYGMQWVITYYKKGIPDWTWQYMYNYGPFIEDLTRAIKDL